MLASHQVIVAMADLLVAAAIAPVGNVERKNRARIFGTFPGVKVFAGDEDLQATDEDITWPPARQHELRPQVDLVVRDPDDLEGAMSAITAEALQALEGTFAAATLAPLQGVALRATRITRRVTTEGEAATGTVSVQFEVVFHTQSNDPETII